METLLRYITHVGLFFRLSLIQASLLLKICFAASATRSADPDYYSQFPGPQSILSVSNNEEAQKLSHPRPTGRGSRGKIAAVWQKWHDD